MSNMCSGVFWVGKIDPWLSLSKPGPLTLSRSQLGPEQGDIKLIKGVVFEVKIT